MKRIGILGDIGSGKSLVAKQFGYPIFNADKEVSQIYKHSKICFDKLKRKLPKYIKSYPINKVELGKAILADKKNLKVVDLTGAGDLFAGGFLDGIIKGKSIAESLEKGTYMASKIIQIIGARLK